MSDERQRIVAEIEANLKQLVDADPRDNREVVKAALWREFGGERLSDIERRIEEKQKRIEHVSDEVENRNQELKELKAELEALRAKRHEKEQESEDKLAEARQRFDVVNLKSLDEPVVDATDDELAEYATELDMSVDDLREVLIDEF